jgi:hypothetical protein
MRDLDRLQDTADRHGASIGIYVHRLLDDPLPWTRMRAVYRLLGLVRRYGPTPVEGACTAALDLDVVSVAKIAAMLAKNLDPPAGQRAGQLTGPATAGAGRFARDPAEFTAHHPTDPRRHLAVVPDPTTEDPTP